jgi:hypothetical protein
MVLAVLGHESCISSWKPEMTTRFNFNSEHIVLIKLNNPSQKMFYLSLMAVLSLKI